MGPRDARRLDDRRRRRLAGAAVASTGGRRSTPRPGRSAGPSAIPDAMLPADLDAFERVRGRRCSGRTDRSSVSAVAARAWRAVVLRPPLGPARGVARRRSRPDAYAWTLWPSVGLLPASVRDDYGLPWGPRERLVSAWLVAGWRAWRPLAARLVPADAAGARGGPADARTRARRTPRPDDCAGQRRPARSSRRSYDCARPRAAATRPRRPDRRAEPAPGRDPSRLPDVRLLTDTIDREGYRLDETAYLHAGLPLAVAFPTTTAEVAELVRLAAEHRVPVVPRGAGTGLSGGAAGIEGGAHDRLHRGWTGSSRSTARTSSAVVQPGIINADLKAAVAAEGLFYAAGSGQLRDVLDRRQPRRRTPAGSAASSTARPATRSWALEVVLADGDGDPDRRPERQGRRRLLPDPPVRRAARARSGSSPRRRCGSGRRRRRGRRCSPSSRLSTARARRSPASTAAGLVAGHARADGPVHDRGRRRLAPPRARPDGGRDAHRRIGPAGRRRDRRARARRDRLRGGRRDRRRPGDGRAGGRLAAPGPADGPPGARAARRRPDGGHRRAPRAGSRRCSREIERIAAGTTSGSATFGHAGDGNLHPTSSSTATTRGPRR